VYRQREEGGCLSSGNFALKRGVREGGESAVENARVPVSALGERGNHVSGGGLGARSFSQKKSIYIWEKKKGTGSCVRKG